LNPLAGWGVLGGILMALFTSIFSIAAYPMEWIDAGFTAAGEWVTGSLSAGLFRDLVVDGVLAGVGGVVIFLPQILHCSFSFSGYWRIPAISRGRRSFWTG
jgi:ferrous iron transport protein B